jgi:hypothetical protein
VTPATAAIGAMNANDDPRKLGILPLVRIRYRIVPAPDVMIATDGFRPVSMGTRTVAPNIAMRC